MAPRSRLGLPPPSASGRSRHDPLLALADLLVSGMWGLSGSLRRPKPGLPRDHSRKLRVVDRRVVAHDENVVALMLAAADGAGLPRWFPGAHIDLHLPSGLVRQYSLNGDPAQHDSYRIAVRRIPDGGGGSIEMHELTVGATVTTGGPRNAFPLSIPGYGSPTQRFRFIAGGIGITPILPMLRQAQALGVDWSMLYVGRSADSLPFVDEVSQYGHRVALRTDDVHGLPTADDLLGDCPDGTAVYACGPAPMLTAIRSRLAGRDNVELHFERFAAPPVVDGEPFSVCIASSGEIVDVGADETLLSALQRCGVTAPYSCQQGFCGTCRTQVLGGTVDHRDTLLTGPERDAGTMLVCISRAPEGERLTLDL
ncbi:MAG TPA: PDR/VanB family oxidoreductase [Mycobacterium sp.]|jgi:ferredoxin-NADP reductase